MIIRIMRPECCGSGECIDRLPDVFELDSKNKACVIDVGAATLAQLVEAAEACPAGAIVIEDDDGNVVHP